MSYPEVFILRHGETEWNRARRMQGHLDSPLTEKGLLQAAQQRDLLESADLPKDVQYHVSPLGRTCATAEIALGEAFAQARFDDRLKEINLGQWDGLTLDEIEAKAPGTADLGYPLWMDTAPGGEGLDGLRGRVAEWLDELDHPAVVVTHGGTSRMMRGVILGLTNAEIGELPGGQGVIYHVKDGVHRIFE